MLSANLAGFCEPFDVEGPGIDCRAGAGSKIGQKPPGARPDAEAMAGEAGADEEARYRVDRRNDRDRIRHRVDHARPALRDLDPFQPGDRCPDICDDPADRCPVRLRVQDAHGFEYGWPVGPARSPLERFFQEAPVQFKLKVLVLARRYTERPEYGHDGVVVAIRSNLRWCSDGFEFTCWNSEIVRGAFIIDAHDREIIAWRAVANAGISGSDVRDIMLEAVETRFGGLRATSAIEMLSDNGSAYTARETRVFARQLGLKPCFTPVRSP